MDNLNFKQTLLDLKFGQAATLNYEMFEVVFPSAKANVITKLPRALTKGRKCSSTRSGWLSSAVLFIPSQCAGVRGIILPKRPDHFVTDSNEDHIELLGVFRS